MSDFAKLFQGMIQQSQEMAKAMNPALEKFQFPDFTSVFPTMPKNAMEMAFGNTFNPGGLDAKTRLFVTLAALVAQGSQLEPQIKLTVRHALEAGATAQEIAEVIGQMSVFGGVPAMTKAMELAQAVIAETEEG
ncbi:carboxymuconolactone decarboxylase family protein [Tropicimonas sp. IMCC6043]|uniref:carboxymuconolactone decarboxylase family protein n=1 Tax=Tropicimonas sp. IMCC6043 TaxID=2510645 RepID=UPI00101D04A2|nr:carboxymuconolactone decarboxylase family protein [Tropicimonas sp. IMCC6043]RYH12349.1 carboxymuconolactone decarboxylase family protein [Tropicimonas sp. IMCC6043]